MNEREVWHQAYCAALQCPFFSRDLNFIDDKGDSSPMTTSAIMALAQNMADKAVEHWRENEPGYREASK